MDLLDCGGSDCWDRVDAMKRKRNLYFGLGPAKVSKRERRKSRTQFQAGVRRKRAAYKSAREKESATLFKQLQKDAKPQRARRAKWTPRDEEAWKQMLRENPMRKLPGDLTVTEISALRKLARINTMSTKKRKRRKKKNPRKGVMPPALRAYWAKKRAKKRNPAKKRRRKARKVNTKRTRARRRRPVSTRVRNYRRPTRRRRRKSNPRRGTLRIKVPRGLGRKGLQSYARLARKAYPGAAVKIV
jgi:hypothetical protein